MSQVIILEGPDGGGKTTLANHLRQRYGFKVLKTNQPEPGEDLFTSYTIALLQALDGWQPAVFDRHYLGECVYGPVMRDEDRLGEMGRTLIERVCAANGVPVVLCLPSWKQLIDNWKAKNGQDYLKNEEQLNKVHNEYFRQFDRLVDREFLNMYRYDMPNMGDITTVLEPVRRLPPGFTGYPEATILMVGEQVNDAVVPWDLPFHALTGCSRYIYDHIKALGVAERDLAWANARDRGGVSNDLAQVVSVMPNLKRVIALGTVAQKVCQKEFGQFELGSPILTVHEVPHPQYWKRFHAGRSQAYQDQLKEAMGL